jgi:hypothetical protein
MEELDKLFEEGPTIEELLAGMPSDLDVDRLLVEVGPSYVELAELWAELELWAERAEAELDRLLVEVDSGLIELGPDWGSGAK